MKGILKQIQTIYSQEEKDLEKIMLRIGDNMRGYSNPSSCHINLILIHILRIDRNFTMSYHHIFKDKILHTINLIDPMIVCG